MPVTDRGAGVIDPKGGHRQVGSISRIVIGGVAPLLKIESKFAKAPHIVTKMASRTA